MPSPLTAPFEPLQIGGLVSGATLADLGRPRVAATILGRLGTGTSELNQTFFGFPELHAELVADLGAAELATLIDDSRSRTLTDLAQLVIQTIDEVR